MSRVDQLKAELKERWSENATVELCLRILDVLDGLPDEELRMLTFASFMNAMHREAIDEELIRAVSLLANTSIHALDSRLLFIDDEEREFEIEKEELAAAKASGEFIHPESGEPVKEFEEKIIPYFVPSQKFMKARAG
jgi:hypothetical protein